MPWLTDKVVQNAKPPAPDEKGRVRQRDLWDQGVPGFGLRVSSTGKRSWILGARILKAGKRVFTRVVLGTYPAMSLSEAREAARQAKILVSEDKDPREPVVQRRAAMEEQSRNTFGFLVDEFFTKYVKRKQLRATTTRDYQQTLKGKDVAAWRNRPVATITKRDVLDAMDGILARGAPIEANHFLTRVRLFFGWCAEREIIQTVPTDRLKPPAKTTRRERALSPEEVREVWAALEALEKPSDSDPRHRGDLFGPMYKLILLTGQRREEVSGMRWDELRGLTVPSRPGRCPGSGPRTGCPTWSRCRGRRRRS